MEVFKTILKLLVIAVVYFGVGPGLGKWMVGKDRVRRVILGFMAWWLVRPRADFTLTLYSIESYRGQTKGFEFNFIEAIALGLSLAAIFERRKDFRWVMPGLLPWLVWVVLSCLSIPGAIEPLYAWMPAFKFLKLAVVMAGVFHAVHDIRDIRALMRGFAIALIVQLFVCLFARYVHGAYRVIGWFEHQNPMAIWCYILALPLLGLAMAKESSSKDSALFLVAFGCAGLVVLLTVSRAALGAFVIGTALVMVASFIHGMTVRRAAMASLMMIGGGLAMAMAMHTFIARMKSAGDDSPENDLRFVLNQQSAAMQADHPVAGVGWNNFGLANSRPLGTKYSEMLETWEANRGHSINPEAFQANPLTESLYWLTLAETGMAGYLGLLLVTLVFLYYGIRNTIAYWRTPIGLFLFGITAALAIGGIHGRVERVLGTETKNVTTLMILRGVLSRVEWWRRKKVPLDTVMKQG